MRSCEHESTALWQAQLSQEFMFMLAGSEYLDNASCILSRGEK